MFNIGAGEMILIALVLLIAVGPEQLPGVIRRTGRVVGQLKTMSDNLRRDFNSSLDEIERAADVKSWAGGELESTVESVKEVATEPFKTDLGVDGSTKVTDMWSSPAPSKEGSADDPAATEHSGDTDPDDDADLAPDKDDDALANDSPSDSPSDISDLSGTADPPPDHDDATDEVA